MIIALIGGHGVGKSTAVRRWEKRYSRLDSYPLDELRSKYYGNPEKCALVDTLHQSARIGVVESAKGYSAWMKQLYPTDPVIIVTPASGLLGGQWMVERRGRPLSDWWKAEQLTYELITKFTRFAAKHLDPTQVKHFSISDKTAGWLEIDDYFGSVYRKLNNRRL